MLNFSKLKILIILFFSIFFILISLNNFIKSNNNFFSKKIKLGLDLQGGSYLLLEIDNKPIIKQTLQSKFIEIKKKFKVDNINYKSINLIDNTIEIETNNDNDEIIKKLITEENSELNPYYPKFKTHQFNVLYNQNF